MTIEEALRKLRGLGWTQEVRPDHPFNGAILVQRSDVEALLKEVADA